MTGPAATVATGIEVVAAVEDLSIDVRTESGWVRVVDDVTFSVRRGECLGLVGESGSGKSLTASVVMGLARQIGVRPSGRVVVDGHDMIGPSERELRRVRGVNVGMIFQEPRRSLDPAFTVGDQIAEAVRTHTGASRRQAWDRAVELLDSVGIPGAARRAHDYPFALSGGMCQRVMLAVALAAGPRLLIADEPTTALDVTVQAGVLDLLRDIQDDTGMAMLFITHDLGVVAQMCDRVAVMYAGQLVEESPAPGLFRSPRHPYTAALIGAIPSLDAPTASLVTIPGLAPSGGRFPAGCRFHPRCAHAVESCATGEQVLVGRGEAQVRCERVDEVELRGIEW
ncbi:MAG: ABC transporter ATP-binding protein [Acidimicrobiia bacterium]